MEFIRASLKTPAFIVDESELFESISTLDHVREVAGCKILFTLKSSSLTYPLGLITSHVDGFSASSIFEARLARGVGDDDKGIHFTAPGLNTEEIGEVLSLCDFVSFNSITQWQRYHEEAREKVSCGLRINTKLPFITDDRYNPCRNNSKLGVALDNLTELIKGRPNILKGIRGLHFHTNCESTDFNQLLSTVLLLDTYIDKIPCCIDWVNIGGGYLLRESSNLDKFSEAIALLRKKYATDVYFEPGKAIIGSAGCIVSRVVDLFESEGRKIAILDTTVNHMPEVFEYQYKPDVAQESEDGEYSYILAGASCLAGDIFGEYRFDEPLEIGSRIIFEDMGAYTLVKANMFNGINLPTIYAYTLEGKLEIKRQFTYEDFLSRCGGNGNVPL